MKTKIRQGGMGVYISSPFLTRLVSILGGIGTVSGVAADRVVARILQLGDIGGHYRRALAQFPFRKYAEQVIDTYFVDGGIKPGTPFKPVPMFTLQPTESVISLNICANFALVWLAKERHTRSVAVNYMEKIQMPLIYNFVGAMLAGADCITMGAGIPLQVAAALDAIALGKNPIYEVDLNSGRSKTVRVEFNVQKFFGTDLAGLKRPDFVPIVSSDILATFLLKRLPGAIQGFVVEGYTAGGHNAPPRGKLCFNTNGEPIYGERDQPDWSKMRELGLPFWIGGGYASPEGLARAIACGAEGIQVGSIFALCRESGMREDLRREICRLAFGNNLRVKTSIKASPTGFPFKLLNLPNTLADEQLLGKRIPICNQGVLLKPYETPDGKISYRCPAEPVERYLLKGGDIEKTAGVCCICNGLLNVANLGDPG